MTTLGDRIKAYRTQLGIKQHELANRASEIDSRDKTTKWGQSRIANYEKGSRTPDLDDIAILGKALNVAPEILAFDNNVLPAKIQKSYSYPLLSSVQAGSWTETFDFRDSEGYEYIESDIKTSGEGFFLRIVGLSMEPKFSEGDLVLIDTKAYPHPGQFVAAVNGNGEATFKQYKELGEISECGKPHFELIPLNPVFPTLSTLKQDIRIIGVAVEHRSYL